MTARVGLVASTHPVPPVSRCPRCRITVLRSSDNATGHCTGCARALAKAP